MDHQISEWVNEIFIVKSKWSSESAPVDWHCVSMEIELSSIPVLGGSLNGLLETRHRQKHRCIRTHTFMVKCRCRESIDIVTLNVSIIAILWLGGVSKYYLVRTWKKKHGYIWRVGWYSSHCHWRWRVSKLVVNNNGLYNKLQNGCQLCTDVREEKKRNREGESKLQLQKNSIVKAP